MSESCWNKSRPAPFNAPPVSMALSRDDVSVIVLSCLQLSSAY